MKSYRSKSLWKNETAPDIGDESLGLGSWMSDTKSKRSGFPRDDGSGDNRKKQPNNESSAVLKYIRDLEDRLQSVEHQLQQSKRQENGETADDEAGPKPSERRPLLDSDDNGNNGNADLHENPLETKSTVMDGDEEGSIRVFGNEVVDDDDDDDDVNTSKAEPEDDLVQFPADTFGFLIVSRPCSIPFFTAWFVVALKNTIFAMVCFDLAGRDPEGISALIPVLVSQSVFVTQLLSYGLLILTQNDLLSAATLLYRGYNEDIQRTFPQGGQKWQWLMSVIMAFVDGAFGISTTFLLVVTSDTVLDVILNFAAVAFVSDLDEIFFALAQIGILGKANFNAAEAVAFRSYRSPIRKVHGLGLQTIRSGLVLVLISVTISMGLLVYARQRQGFYTADAIWVQLGSDVRPNLALHSGFYRRSDIQGFDGILGTGREGFVYLEEREGGIEGRGKIAYCISRSVWTFTWDENGSACSNTQIESSNTDSYDVIEAAASPWFVRLPGLSQSIPMQGFYLSTGCDTDSDCGGGNGDNAVSQQTGFCRNHRCHCAPGYSGTRCLYNSQNTCPEVLMDEQVSSTFPVERDIAREFEKYSGGECYGRPVYWNRDTQDVIFFSGSRWAVSRLNQVLAQADETSGDDTINATAALEFLVSANFHSSVVKEVDLLSEEVLFRTAKDRDNSPTSLSWLSVGSSREELAQVDNVLPLSTPARLVCSKCNDETNPCENEGVCLNTGVCDCSESNATGTRCEVMLPLS